MYDETFQAHVWPVIISLMDQYVAPVYSGRVSRNVPASLTTFPVGVYQSADGGGKNDDMIGQNGWKGFITFRSIDLTQSGAMNRLLQVAAVLPTIVHSGYAVSFHIDRPQEFPIEKITTSSVYTSALVLSVGIYPK